MLVRLFRFVAGPVSSLVTTATVVAVLWGLFGVGPDRAAFWIVVGALGTWIIVFDGIVRLVLVRRGVDVGMARERFAHAAAADVRKRYGDARGNGRLRRPLRFMIVSGVSFVAGLGLAQVWTPFATLAILGALGLLYGEGLLFVRLGRRKARD